MTRPRASLLVAISMLAGPLGLGALAAQSPAQAPAQAPAQTPAQDADRPLVFATGVSAGAMRFNGGRLQQDLTAIFQYQPVTWLTFSVTPGMARSTIGDTTSSGPTDVPVSAGASHSFGDLPWSPSLAASLTETIATGSATGVGLGHGTLGSYASIGASPTDGWDFDVGTSQPLHANGGNPSVELETSVQLGRISTSVGMSREMGVPDSGAVLGRSLAAGLRIPLMGKFTLGIDGSRGLTTGAPSWTLALGVGTAFAGHSPLSPTSALRSLRSVFGAKASSSNGYKGQAISACKRAKTC